MTPDLAWLLSNGLVGLFVVAALVRIASGPGPDARQAMTDGGQEGGHDLKAVQDDLEQLRAGGPDADSGSSRTDRQVGAGDVPDLGLGDGEGSAPKWLRYGIYAALIIAIIQIYVGIPVPDPTLLVVAALAFLVLGLWAGMRMHEELGRVAERFNEWRSG